MPTSLISSNLSWVLSTALFFYFFQPILPLHTAAFSDSSHSSWDLPLLQTRIFPSVLLSAVFSCAALQITHIHYAEPSFASFSSGPFPQCPHYWGMALPHTHYSEQQPPVSLGWSFPLTPTPTHSVTSWLLSVLCPQSFFFLPPRIFFLSEHTMIIFSFWTYHQLTIPRL